MDYEIFERMLKVYNFFEPNDAELLPLISSFLKRNDDEIVNFSHVDTGWTNIVINVKSNKNEYIFRFPRNTFFAKEMLRDYTFCKLVQHKVWCTTPDMQLIIDNNRPFSVHPKISGTVLSSYDFKSFSNNEISKLADGIGHFLSELHKIPIAAIPDGYNTYLTSYLDELSEVHCGDYELKTHEGLRRLENAKYDLCLVHGDFNPGNILVDKNLNISAVIDFSFGSISDRNADIGRLLSRTDLKFCRYVLDAYNSYSNRPCNESRAIAIANVFKYVDWKYVQYICRNMPSITVSKALLNDNFDMSIFKDNIA